MHNAKKPEIFFEAPEIYYITINPRFNFLSVCKNSHYDNTHKNNNVPNITGVGKKGWRVHVRIKKG